MGQQTSPIEDKTADRGRVVGQPGNYAPVVSGSAAIIPGAPVTDSCPSLSLDSPSPVSSPGSMVSAYPLES